MQILRTKDECFASLPGYNFEPRYMDVGSGETRARMHYVEAGAGERIVLLLHGQPSWSYLYRNVIRHLLDANANLRILAPDLIGFGRSDKPASTSDYTYARHMQWLTDFVDGLGLQNITMYVQDWGGLLGLRLAGQRPDLFAGIVAANTGLPTGHQTMPQVWHDFKRFCTDAKRLPVGRMIAQGCARPMADDVKRAYASPYPDDSYCAGVRAFPGLIPLTPEDPEGRINYAAVKSLRKFERPFLTAFSDSDPITRGGDLILQRLVAGAKSQKHVTVTQAGHFLQEDAPDQVSRSILQILIAN